jgi:hypothetical protein
MGRAERRHDLHTFRRITRVELSTWLIEAGDVHFAPLLQHAVAHWWSNVPARRPFCISCRASFATDGTSVGAFLFAMPLSSGEQLVSTSAICGDCWERLQRAAAGRAGCSAQGFATRKRIELRRPLVRVC